MAVSAAGYGMTSTTHWNNTSGTVTTNSWTVCDKNGNWKVLTNGTTNFCNLWAPEVEYVEVVPNKLPAGQRTMELPDGAKLVVDDMGNYRIEDKDAKVTYQANRIREFSPYLNASDMLAKFVEYVGSLGVKQSEVLGLPLELFINWLVIEAAERDSDPIPSDVVPIPQHHRIKSLLRPKCLTCGRFIKRLYMKHNFPFCHPEHGSAYVQRKQLAYAGNSNEGRP